MKVDEKNPLAEAPIGKLMTKYAIPSVVALVVNALYNIVDQIFIGWGVGTLGNSATNVVFPLSMVVTALSLLLGDGGAAYLSLELGRGNKEKAQKGANNTLTWLIIVGIVMFLVCFIFLKPLVGMLGATTDNLPYALEYGRIVVCGFPFVVIGSGLCSVIRSDGTPQLTMIGMIIGCIINVVLDAIFVLGCGWGMTGAAVATIIGQIVNFLITIWYLPHFKTCKINLHDMKPQLSLLSKIASLGVSSFIAQFAVAVVMAVVNYFLVKYGAASEYGSDIPLAAFGIVMKFNTILIAVVTGIGTGAQPIVGYNYGRGDITRVKKTYFLAVKCATIFSIICFKVCLFNSSNISYFLAVKCATIFSIICFIVFQAFPYQLTEMFGDQGQLYTQFSIMSFRIFTLLCFFNGFQVVTAIFFQSIGKPLTSGIISFSRQIIFFIPAVIIWCACVGLNGVLYAGPTGDGLAFILALVLILIEMKKLNKMEQSPAGK